MTSMRTFRAVAIVLPAVLLMAAPAAAQSGTGSLRERLVQFGSPIGSEQALATLADLTALEVSTAPLGASTGGFTFTFDPVTGTFKRSSDSFGPTFAERSNTGGKGQVSVGFNWLHASYSSFAGYSLDNGEFQPAINVRNFLPLPATDHTELTLDIASDTVVAYAHYGLRDNVDVGIAIPWVRVGVEGQSGFFDANRSLLLPKLLLDDVSASGVGDIALLGKYNFWKRDRDGAAASIEIRLPSGDEDALRGLGVGRVAISGIWSREGMVSPHANVGYEFWTDDVSISEDSSVAASGQFRYAFGVEYTPSPKTTLALDLVGRRVNGAGSVGYQSFSDPNLGSLDALVALPEGISIVSLAPGIKYNAGRNTLVSFNLLASLSDSGLRASVVPVLGVDFAF